jgi:hypothetical protein
MHIPRVTFTNWNEYNGELSGMLLVVIVTPQVASMLEGLEWRTLQDRKKITQLCMLYKINNASVAIWKEDRLVPLNRHGRHHHSRSFQIPQSRIDSHRMSFFPRTIREWNELPDETVQVQALESFKALVSIF